MPHSLHVQIDDGSVGLLISSLLFTNRTYISVQNKTCINNNNKIKYICSSFSEKKELLFDSRAIHCAIPEEKFYVSQCKQAK